MRFLLFISFLAFLLPACGKKSTTMTSVDLVGQYQQYGGLPQLALAVGSTEKFQAIANYDDKHWEDHSSDTTWSTNLICPTSSDPGTPGDAIATVDSSGTVTGVSGGVVNVVAQIGTFIGCFELTISGSALVSISVTPVNPSVAAGLTQQFTATGTYADGSTGDITHSVTWSTSNLSIATVSNTSATRGLATGAAVGVATITATLGAVSGNTDLTVTPAVLVSIAVTPANPNVRVGQTQQFTATGTYSDHTTQDLTNTVVWASSDVTKATIAAHGLATAVAVGTTTITATSGLISGSTTLTVPSLVSITVTPANQSLTVNLTQQYTATGTYSDSSTQDLTNTVVWASTDVTKATIAVHGLVTAVAAGVTTITATSGLVSGNTTLTVIPAVLVSIAVNPTSANIQTGHTQQYTATGTYSDNSTANITALVVWSSSSAGTATISNAGGSNGLATGVSIGLVNFTATSGSIHKTVGATITP